MSNCRVVMDEFGPYPTPEEWDSIKLELLEVIKLALAYMGEEAKEVSLFYHDD